MILSVRERINQRTRTERKRSECLMSVVGPTIRPRELAKRNQTHQTFLHFPRLKNPFCRTTKDTTTSSNEVHPVSVPNGSPSRKRTTSNNEAATQNSSHKTSWDNQALEISSPGDKPPSREENLDPTFLPGSEKAQPQVRLTVLFIN